MHRPNALQFFRGDSGYNCAQAVLKCYASHVNMGEACLDRFAHFGSGRAPEGECGALFAAKAFFEDTEAQEQVEQKFLAIARTTKCRDIRRGRHATCEQCVQAAADAVFTQLSSSTPLRRPSQCA